MTSARKKKRSEACRIALIDDHQVVLDSLSLLIQQYPDLEVCGMATDAQGAMRLLSQEKIDLMVIDIALPDRSGIDLIRDLLAYQPDLLVICLSALDEMRYARLALQAGARGYLNKRVGATTLVEAIATVRKGGVHVSPDVNASLLQRLVGIREEGPAYGHGVDRLTSRESEVFSLIGRGLSTSEIAKKLRLSPNTVQRHKENIKTKLGIKTPEQLIRRAIEAFREWTQAGQAED